MPVGFGVKKGIVMMEAAAIQLLNQAMSSESNQHEYRWCDLLTAFQAIADGYLLGFEAERALLNIVRFEGKFCLSGDSELHSMSPEEMLKSLAIQALAKWHGNAHLDIKERDKSTC